MVSTDVDLETVVFRKGTFATEVPFSGKERPVAAFAKSLGQRNVFVGKMAIVLGRQQPRIPLPIRTRRGANPVSNIQPRRVLACHNTGSRWAADLTRGVAASETHPFVGNPVDVWALVEFAPPDTQVPPAQVIRQNKNNIRSFRGDAGNGRGKDE